MEFVRWVNIFNKPPKLWRVIHLLGVAKLVYEDIVNKFVGELHERDIETDSPVAAATTPATTGMRKAHGIVTTIELIGKMSESFRQIALGFDTQGCSHGVAYHTFDGRISQLIAVL